MNQHTRPTVYSSLKVQAAQIIDTYHGEMVLMNNDQGDEIFVTPTEEAQMQDLGYRRKSVLDEAYWYRPSDVDNANSDQWYGPYETEVEMHDAIDEEYLGDGGQQEEGYQLNKLPSQRAANDITAVMEAGLDSFVGDEDLSDLFDLSDDHTLPSQIPL